MSTPAIDNNPSIRDWRLWWFARLESALDRHDNDAARHALARLARLGVEVRFLLPPAACTESEGAAHV